MSTLNQGISGKTSVTVLVALSTFHLCNDALQSLVQSSYLNIQQTFSLNYTGIGLITLCYQIAASIFQPLVGWYTDRHPQPYSLPFGMFCSMIGLLTLAHASSYPMVLLAVVLIGIGSAIFHPESSRLSYLGSGGRFGFAQSLFQVGGNFGSSLGPLIVAAWVVHMTDLSWFALIPLVAMLMTLPICQWYKRQIHVIREKRKAANLTKPTSPLPTRTVALSLCVLLVLIFSKYVYWASLGSYYMLYLKAKFQVPDDTALHCLFLFSFSVAAGTMIGGPIGDRIGRKYVIWVSILGVAPFTMLLPHVNSLPLTCVLTVIIGLVLSSAFSAILIFAQELMPGKVGMIAGMFFGFAFGIAGISSAILGRIADIHGIEYVYKLCSYLPLLGIFTIFLPNLRKIKSQQPSEQK